MIQVLFVDDEASVLDDLRNMLLLMGVEWDIYLAESAEEALKVFENGIVDGLFKKICGTGLERASRRRNVAIGGHDDHRQIGGTSAKFGVKFQAAHARHANIDEHAAKPLRVVGFQQILGICKDLRTEALQAEQKSERITHGRIVFAHSELQGNMNMAHAMLEGKRGASQAMALL